MDDEDVFRLLSNELESLESDLIPSGQILKEDATPATASKDSMAQVANLVLELRPQFRELSLLTNWSSRTKSALAEDRPIAQTLINKEPPRLPSRYSTYSQPFLNDWKRAIRGAEMELTRLWSREMEHQLKGSRLEWRKLKDRAVTKLNGNEAALKTLEKKLKQSNDTPGKTHHQGKRRRSEGQ